MIQVEWGNAEKTIILWRFTYPWTWMEYNSAQKDVSAMIETVSGQVDSVFLASKEQIVPKDAIIHLRKILKQRHERSNRVVIVGAQTRLSTLIKMLLGLVPSTRVPLRFADTLEEAYAFLAERSESVLEERTG